MVERLARILARLWARSKLLSLILAIGVGVLFYFAWPIFKVILVILLAVIVLFGLIRIKGAVLVILVIGIVVIGFTGIPLKSSNYTDDGIRIHEGKYFALFNPKYIARKYVRSHQNREAIHIKIVSPFTANLVAYGADNYSLIGQLFRLGSFLSNSEREQIGTFTVVFGWR